MIYLLLNKETNQYSIEILNLRDYSKLTLKEFTDEIIDHKYINFDVYQEKIYKNQMFLYRLFLKSNNRGFVKSIQSF